MWTGRVPETRRDAPRARALFFERGAGGGDELGMSPQTKVVVAAQIDRSGRGARGGRAAAQRLGIEVGEVGGEPLAEGHDAIRSMAKTSTPVTLT